MGEVATVGESEGGVMSTWIRTYTGKKFDFSNIKHEMITLEDIAHVLSRICRYGNHIPAFYSVAQHSVLVSQKCKPENALIGLLHDATEAYMGDVVRPLKNLLPHYRMIETKVHTVIAERFDLPNYIPNDVKEADTRMLITEKRDVLRDTTYWGKVFEGVEPYHDFTIEPISSEDAWWLFLDRFFELKPDAFPLQDPGDYVEPSNREPFNTNRFMGKVYKCLTAAWKAGVLKHDKYINAGDEKSAEYWKGYSAGVFRAGGLIDEIDRESK